MFSVLKCPKCGHVITGAHDFIREITERIQINSDKFRKNKDPMLLQENALLRSYMKQVLHNQTEIERYKIRSAAMLHEVIKYGKDQGFLTVDALRQLQEKADIETASRMAAASKKIEQIYGDYGNYCSNAIKPDPTAQSVVKEKRYDRK